VVEHSKFQLMDDEFSLKLPWSHQVTQFKFWGHQSYFRNGWS